MNKPIFAVVHCSASGFGNADMIDKWHKARKWKGIGYHYVIRNGFTHNGGKYERYLDGEVQTGRGHSEIGAHCLGLNDKSIGICLIGDHTFTLGQFIALDVLLATLEKQYPGIKAIGHYESEENGGEPTDKTCPNFSMGAFRAWTKR